MMYSGNVDQIFIIELKREHILLIAQLVHLHMVDGPLAIGQDLLDSLRVQTDFVSVTPKDHKVYYGPEAPLNAIQSGLAWHIPMDTKSA